ncbi:MAG: hypothetical protein EXS36_17510 [Pedosphaera sp.]|nr:hypothetical protein [Pedosphaera sp.]
MNGAHDNLLGSLDSGFNFPYNLYGSDAGYSILIEGPDTAFNTINSRRFGVGAPFGPGSTTLIPAGLGAIAIRNRSNNNTVGHVREDLWNSFFAWKNAALLIDDSESNLVVGNLMTGVNTVPGVVGVHLRNGARANTIGQPGAAIQIFSLFQFSLRFGNVISICSDTGILVEDSGGTLRPDGLPEKSNRIVNNQLKSNMEGLRIGPRSWGNVIGDCFRAMAINSSETCAPRSTSRETRSRCRNLETGSKTTRLAGVP